MARNSEQLELEDILALRAQAERIAEAIITFAHKNAKLLLDDARRERIDADVSTSGWLRLALNAREEAALKAEVAMGRRLGASRGGPKRSRGPPRTRSTQARN